MDQTQTVHVYIISDGTGITAERVIRAALVQFDRVDPNFMRFPYIQTVEQLEEVLDQSVASNSIVIYSLVSEALRLFIKRSKHHKSIYTIDLLGPLLKQLQHRWNMLPVFRPGLLKGLGEETYRLAESIDYTLKHDDGQNIETLADAELVILGVSRTSKTPTSLYISCNNNLKVANIPIIPDFALPRELFTVKARKIGFTIAPEKLAIIRQKRMRYAGQGEYGDMRAIRSEVLYSHRIFRTIPGLRVIEVTNRSIEEIADQII
ncbi:MAG TPA: pyruvate, water dikinase regulatory protein [Desulfobacterales bacterium]